MNHFVIDSALSSTYSMAIGASSAVYAV